MRRREKPACTHSHTHTYHHKEKNYVEKEGERSKQVCTCFMCAQRALCADDELNSWVNSRWKCGRLGVRLPTKHLHFSQALLHIHTYIAAQKKVEYKYIIIISSGAPWLDFLFLFVRDEHGVYIVDIGTFNTTFNISHSFIHSFREIAFSFLLFSEPWPTFDFPLTFFFLLLLLLLVPLLKRIVYPPRPTANNCVK